MLPHDLRYCFYMKVVGMEGPAVTDRDGQPKILMYLLRSDVKLEQCICSQLPGSNKIHDSDVAGNSCQVSAFHLSKSNHV